MRSRTLKFERAPNAMAAHAMPKSTHDCVTRLTSSAATLSAGGARVVGRRFGGGTYRRVVAVRLLPLPGVSEGGGLIDTERFLLAELFDIRCRS
jgi:hypothetical protein